MIDKNRLSITSGEVWEKAYSLKNYMVKQISDSNETCVIYFSSSSIYYPNTENAMKEQIIDKNFYEWKKYPILNANRFIYVRDVAKQFYIYGISKECASINELIKLLEELTKGYNIITVGSSAGGYMASLAGALLKAKTVYCFSGFFSLSNVNQEVWYLLKKEKENSKYNQYYEIAKYMEEAIDTSFFYIMPGLSKDEINNDSVQYEYVKNIPNVYALKIKEKEHGVCMYPYVLKEFINKDTSEMKKIFRKYKGRLVSKWKFSILVIGIRRSVILYIQYIWKRIKNVIKVKCLK